jgi:hypothetical protein
MISGSFFALVLLIMYIEWKFSELHKMLHGHARQLAAPAASSGPAMGYQAPNPYTAATQNLFVKTPAAMSQLLFDDSSSGYAPFAAPTRLLE